MEDLKRIEDAVLVKLQNATTEHDITQIRSEYLGKKGAIGKAMQGLRELAANERPQAGQRINEVKQAIEAALESAQKRINAVAVKQKQKAGSYDVTLPGRRVIAGAPHPLRLVEAEVIRILTELGFSVAEGPLVEHDWYTFEALNIPANHPARDMQDTFFITEQVVLRPHTSNVQTRVMLGRKPPLRIVAPGMTFRNDDIDPTHSPVFHQIEGFWVDEKVTFADLKGVLHRLAERLFGVGAKVRFRPSFFPFTEPSAEVDVSCSACGGVGGTCRVCKGTGWLEILGSGMIDPAVFEAVGYNPEKVQGFAFGMGIERIAMLRYGIDDIRVLFENDLRFLRQFG
ncbi:MAG: phenylalanine--tRNA ligase subunit alpha [Deltaproteobacteria bacterium]|nr:phenylalanine--tRNA ligase subunit alpha [Deltaproteobacteria bacterium]